MNTLRKIKQSKRKNGDNGKGHMGFCIQSLKMQIFISFFQGIALELVLLLTQALMRAPNPHFVSHSSFLLV